MTDARPYNFDFQQNDKSEAVLLVGDFHNGPRDAAAFFGYYGDFSKYSNIPVDLYNLLGYNRIGENRESKIKIKPQRRWLKKEKKDVSY